MRFQYGNAVVVTGGSSGIGLACAEMFAADGYTVFSLSRHAQEGILYRGKGAIHTLACDVCSEASVDAACQKITEVTSDIGIVVHSAGFGISGAAEDMDLKLAERLMDTNYFGVLRVNKRLLPVMRKRGSGFVVVIGSVAGLVSIPFQSHYSASKYALEAYTEALRIEGRPYGIRACIIEPGDTKTGFTSARIKNELCRDSPYLSACEKSVAKMEKDEQKGRPPNTVARTVMLVAGKKNPPVRVAVGMEYKLIILLKKILPSRLISFIVAKIYASN